MTKTFIRRQKNVMKEINLSRRGENIYKRKDGRWEARVLDNSRGKYKYFYGKSYNEVKSKKINWIKGNRKPKKKTDGNLSISDSLISWLSTRYGYVKNATYESYYYCLNKHIIPYFKKNNISYITEEEVKKFCVNIYSNSELSHAYKTKILQILKTALKEILDTGGEKQLILDALKLPKCQDEFKRIEIFSVYEQSIIEEILLQDGTNLDTGLMICLYTGIRLGELCALKWEDVDLEARLIRINKTLLRTRNFEKAGKKTKLVLNSPKSRSSIRNIPLPDFLCQMIYKLSSETSNKNDFILSDCPQPIDPRTVQRYHEKVLQKACIDHRKFHAMRHTFATRALELGIDIRTLSDILGHSKISTTLDIYAHSLLEQKRLAISKMNSLHNKKMVIAAKSKAVNKAVRN